MALYNLSLIDNILSISFGDPASNAEIVPYVVSALGALRFPGGPLLKISGPASLPVAVAIAHAVGHLYGAIAVYDPKLVGFVVCISHGSGHAIGDVI